MSSLPPALAAAAGDAGEARRRAAEILSDDRFSSSQPAVTGEGRSLLDRIFDGIGWLLEQILGGPATGFAWWILAALLVVIVVAVAVLSRPSTGRVRRESVTGHDADEAPRADELDAEADSAQLAGRFEASVRLRFRAGVARLDEQGVLTFDPSLTSGQLAGRLRLQEFDALAADFDRIVYGGAPATAHDAATARAGWRDVAGKARPS